MENDTLHFSQRGEFMYFAHGDMHQCSQDPLESRTQRTCTTPKLTVSFGSTLRQVNWQWSALETLVSVGHTGRLVLMDSCIVRR